jgi:hypothetical protein
LFCRRRLLFGKRQIFGELALALLRLNVSNRIIARAVMTSNGHDFLGFIFFHSS